MKIFEANIDPHALSFFKSNIKALRDVPSANTLLENISGIVDFFHSDVQIKDLKQKIDEPFTVESKTDRREYGDFQTNDELARQITEYVVNKKKYPEFILEPTCGKGAFLLASLKTFPNARHIIGIEIFEPYVWETKFKILSYFIENPKADKPKIEIIHANIFDYPLENIAAGSKNLNTLIVGNPPWVTNSELGTINSKNLPKKSNFKKHNGIDAITGKGNFDIGEYITHSLLKSFHKNSGVIAFLVKGSVIKNIIAEQKKNKFKITDIEKLNIDSKKEFNVSVDASLFYADFSTNDSASKCKELDFYSQKERTVFGWVGNKFVYSLADYEMVKDMDGESPYVWRQGLKHDCAKVMELEKYNGHYKNALGEDVMIENDLVFGLLKSSDLKTKETNRYRKSTIVTQTAIGQDTRYINFDYPLTYNYLKRHSAYFDKRKSSIYKGKPKFSIFGIGDYAFKPYKVAISGMYKTTHFTLVMPDEKPVMLDDTCYFLSFDDRDYARITHHLLNSEYAQKLLKSLIFSDTKRAITKDILMRIDMGKILDVARFENIVNLPDIEPDKLKSYREILEKKDAIKQMTLF